MKDRIRYSEAFKLKVMEEFRDGKWKSVKEVAMAYGVAEMSVYYWMRKLGFEHLKGRLIYVNTRSEIDEIKRLREENRQLKLQLADRVLDHEIDKATLKIACERLGMPVDELKKERFRVAHEVDSVVKRSKRKISEKLGTKIYRSALDAHGWTCSMTEELHCYENAMAERLNGILKGEHGLDAHFKTKTEAITAIKQAIMIYNHRRIH